MHGQQNIKKTCIRFKLSPTSQYNMNLFTSGSDIFKSTTNAE